MEICDEFRRILAEDPRAGLPPELSGHPETCAGCREWLSDLQRTRAALDAAAPDQAEIERMSRALRGRLAGAVSRPMRPGPSVRRRLLSPRSALFRYALVPLGAAAAALLYLNHLHTGRLTRELSAEVVEAEGQVELVVKGRSGPAGPGRIIRPGGEVKVAPGAYLALRYPDGTAIDVFGAAELVLQEHDAARRIRLEEGEIRAEVTRQRGGRPMVIATPQAEAKVLGTALSLSVAGGSTRLEVEEGTVRLTRAGDGESVDVSAGQYAVAAKGVKLLALALPAASGPVAVLDGRSPWRIHYSWNAAGAKAAGATGRFSRRLWKLRFITLFPPKGWTEPGFDDSGWARMHLDHKPANCVTVRRLCMRGKFTVTDPARVASLRLTLGFKGGAVVYLNGKEVARQNLPAEQVEPGSPAQGRSGKIENQALPAKLLRKGANVLAVEIHAAHPDTAALKEFNTMGGFFPPTCEVEAVRLEAEGGSGIVANVERPKGAGVWNSSIVAPLYQFDWGDPHDRLRPIRLAGARNGHYSGRVVVTSDKPIRGLRAEASDLSGPSGRKIPTSHVRLGYGGFQWEFPDGHQLEGYHYSCGMSAFVQPGQYKGIFQCRAKHRKEDLLKDTAPREVPLHERYGGAVQSVWVTVHVPKDSPAGDYRGALELTMQGERPVEVPVELKVIDWTLPGPDDFTYLTGVVQSPCRLALCYGVEPWSEEHLDLVGKSLELARQLGNRVLYIPLVEDTHSGNDRSMVLWIKDKNGFRHDFRPVERYLDAALKRGWKPRYVVFEVWHKSRGRVFEEFNSVTVKDPETGKVSSHRFEHGKPEALELWRPVLTRAREILASRGLEKAMLLGHVADMLPGVDTVRVFHSILPGVGWKGSSHHTVNFLRFKGEENPSRHTPAGGHPSAERWERSRGEIPPNAVPLVFSTNWLGAQRNWDPDEKRVYGWKNPRDFTFLLRFMVESPLEYRVNCEQALLAGRRGLGQIGADRFPYLLKEGSGRVRYMFPRGRGRLHLFPKCILRSGPEGPIRSVGYEMFRENIQECEARIFLEKLLTAEPCPLPAGLAKRCQEVLDERTRWHRMGYFNCRTHIDFRPMGYSWPHSGMQGRTIKLYEACAEAARATGVRFTPAARSRPVPKAEIRRPAEKPARRAAGVEDEKRASSLLKTARTALRRGQRAAARSFLERIVRDYPGTEAAKEAGRLLEGAK